MTPHDETEPSADETAKPAGGAQSTGAAPGAAAGAGVPASSFVRNSTFNVGPGNRPMRRQEGPRRLKNGIRLRRREGISGVDEKASRAASWK